MMKLACALLASLCIASVAQAAPLTIEVPYTCPVGGEKFKNTERAAVYEAGKMLDLRPYGSYDGIWPLPVCPGNGLVMHKKSYSEAEVAKLAEFIATPEYARLRAQDTTYYRASRLAAVLGEEDASVFDKLLKATWQAQDTPEYPRYAQEALAMLEGMLAKPELQQKPAAVTWQLLAGEFERRTGRFAEARRRFEQLRGDARFDAPMFQDVIAFQIELIDRQDVGTHKIPKAKS